MRAALRLVAAAFALVVMPATALAAGAVGDWRAAGRMEAAHAAHSATLLADGTVLVAGGESGNGPTADAELYNPNRNTWTEIPAMPSARGRHTATLLPDGRVLIVGGFDGHERLVDPALYLPDTRSWAAAAPIHTNRLRHSATLLPDGRVLVAGGTTDGNAATSSTELYNPATGNWQPGPALVTARMDHVAVALADGRVLIAGGVPRGDNPDASIDSAELLDPGAVRWTLAAPMGTPRASAVGVRLPDGEVAVAGGFDYPGGFAVPTNTVSLFNPADNRWTDGPPMRVARARSSGAVLAGGDLLIAGGFNSRQTFRSDSSAEIWQPGAKEWSLLPATGIRRTDATVTALPAGGGLVVGGVREATAQLFLPAPPDARGAGLGSAAAALPRPTLALLGATAVLGLIALGQELARRRRRSR